MAKDTVLVLSTYPIHHPLHGGQRRAAALNRALKQGNLRPLYVAIYNPPSYVNAYEHGPHDIRAGKVTLARIKETPILEDVYLGEACVSDPDVRQQLEALIRRYRPAAIMFEQPYLYIGAELLFRELAINPKIIYSSHNVEWRMKEKIYAAHHKDITSKVASQAVKRVRQAEEKLARRSKLLLTVSESDTEEYIRMGARIRGVLIVPNGIDPPRPTTRALGRWQSFKDQYGVRKFVLFTGSAHPPNWSGFLHMLGDRLGFLPIDVKLMTVGDIGDALSYVTYREDPVYASSFWLRAYNCKRLSDAELSALITMSSVILLPITEGGGSNLKTAEAIYSGKQVLATSYAMRGYDEFKDFPNIYIEDDPMEFKSKLAALIAATPAERTQEQVSATEKVLWNYRTKDVAASIRKVL